MDLDQILDEKKICFPEGMENIPGQIKEKLQENAFHEIRKIEFRPDCDAFIDSIRDPKRQRGIGISKSIMQSSNIIENKFIKLMR